MDVRIRVTQQARTLNLHVCLRVPYSDFQAARKVLERFLADLLRRGR